MFSSANTPTFTLALDGVAQDFQVLAFDAELHLRDFLGSG